MGGRPTLPLSQLGQGHLRVIIYTNIVELLFLPLNAKFQIHKPSDSVDL